jgi:hypothetical protein
MECDLLSLHPFYQFLNSNKEPLIRDARRHETVMLDFAVEFDTLGTHFGSAFAQAAVTIGCFS